MAGELLFVAGCVQVDALEPKSARAVEFREAAQKVNKTGLATIYVLGSLFAPGTPKDACITYLESIPGRKVLVSDGRYCNTAELTCGAWHNVTPEVRLDLWGKHIRLAVDPPVHGSFGGSLLLLHVGGRADTGNSIRVLWDDWHDRFGPAGINSIYALSVLADQIGHGLVAEPSDGR